MLLNADALGKAEPGQRPPGVSSSHRRQRQPSAPIKRGHAERAVAPQQDILRVADRRQQRAGVDRQRFKDDQPGDGQARELAQRQR